MSPKERILQFFGFDHLPEGSLRDTSKACHDLAYYMADTTPDSAEQTTGLRKLLEAKDCFVRSHLDKSNQ